MKAAQTAAVVVIFLWPGFDGHLFLVRTVVILADTRQKINIGRLGRWPMGLMFLLLFVFYLIIKLNRKIQKAKKVWW